MQELKKSYAVRRGRMRKQRRQQRIRLFALAVLIAGGFLLTRALISPVKAETEDSNAINLSESHLYRVAIDPGHGGSDHGSVGMGFMEDEMTWQTANLLAVLLEQDGRFEPFLTLTPEQRRDPSKRIMPSERGRNAREQGAELLLSIHGNSDSDGSTFGFECFPVPPGLEYHDDSQRFGELLAGQLERDGQRLRGVNGVRYLYYDSNDNRVIIESGSDQMSGTPTFTILETCGCPAVLAEQCFITNEGDVCRYAGDEGCARAAHLYYQAILDYYGLA